MIATVTFEDGEEQTIALKSPTTRGRSLREGFWTFRLDDGRELSFADVTVRRVELEVVEVPSDPAGLEAPAQQRKERRG
jgi:hypothetical protein